MPIYRKPHRIYKNTKMLIILESGHTQHFAAIVCNQYHTLCKVVFLFCLSQLTLCCEDLPRGDFSRLHNIPVSVSLAPYQLLLLHMTIANICKAFSVPFWTLTWVNWPHLHKSPTRRYKYYSYFRDEETGTERYLVQSQLPVKGGAWALNIPAQVWFSL